MDAFKKRVVLEEGEDEELSKMTRFLASKYVSKLSAKAKKEFSLGRELAQGKITPKEAKAKSTGEDDAGEKVEKADKKIKNVRAAEATPTKMAGKKRRRSTMDTADNSQLLELANSLAEPEAPLLEEAAPRTKKSLPVEEEEEEDLSGYNFDEEAFSGDAISLPSTDEEQEDSDEEDFEEEVEVEVVEKKPSKVSQNKKQSAGKANDRFAEPVAPQQQIKVKTVNPMLLSKVQASRLKQQQQSHQSAPGKTSKGTANKKGGGGGLFNNSSGGWSDDD